MCSEMKSIDIKGKQYIEVNERIKYFRANFIDWSLESEILSIENGVCVIKATIRDNNGIIKAIGHAYEKEDSSFINKTSYIENCETSAWGRALGNLGIGIDTSIASAEEVQNAILNQEKPTKKAVQKAESEEDYNNKLDEQLGIMQAKYHCADCSATISDKVANYSHSIYGKPLCMNCQKKNKKLA